MEADSLASRATAAGEDESKVEAAKVQAQSFTRHKAATGGTGAARASP
jgi:hypothetical protein